MARLRVLLTGFGPFSGVPENPSACLAEKLGERPWPRGFEGEITTRILPTEWAETALVPRLYAKLQPHVMIHFGLSERARTFRIERSAFNRTMLRADARGVLPSGSTISPDGPDRMHTALPAPALVAHLNAFDIPAATSRAPGSYLCNFLYYHSLDWARRQEDTCLVLFVHIPLPAGKGGPLAEETLLRGARKTLRFVLDVAHAQRPIHPPNGRALAGTNAKDA